MWEDLNSSALRGAWKPTNSTVDHYFKRHTSHISSLQQIKPSTVNDCQFDKSQTGVTAGCYTDQHSPNAPAAAFTAVQGCFDHTD